MKRIKIVFQIAKAELQEMFYSPIAWVTLILLLVQLAINFGGILDSVVSTLELNKSLIAVSDTLFTSGKTGLFVNMLKYLGFYIPLLTMGIISREFATGSIKLLYSSPISNWQIVVGKYIAIVIYVLVMVAALGLYVAFGAAYVVNFDIWAILTGLLGIFLLLITYASIGVFMSALTLYPILAAIYTFIIVSALNLIGGLGQGTDFLSDITYWLAINGRAGKFITGLICSEDIIYFISISAAFVAMTIIKINADRQGIRFSKQLAHYSCVIIILVAVAYTSSRPALKLYADATQIKKNTLLEKSQEILSRIDGELTITGYANYLEQKSSLMLPEEKNRNLDRFEKYLRFKPDIKFDYVYFYDELLDAKLSKQDQGKTLRERMLFKAGLFQRDTLLFLTPEEISKKIDLSDEYNRSTFIISTEDGRTSKLRLFDDASVFPDEAQITAALQILVDTLPKVGVVTGYGMRSTTSYAEKAARMVFNQPRLRASILNNGFSMQMINLDEDKGDIGVDILVVLDPTEGLSPVASERLDKYIETGVDMFITTDIGHQEAINPIIQRFGIYSREGILANILKDNPYNLAFSYLSKEIDRFGRISKTLSKAGYPLVFNGAVALGELSGDNSFNSEILMHCADSSAWIELNTTNFIDEIATTDEGEIQKSEPLAYHLNRDVNGEEQTIFVFGDSDFVSNAEVTTRRKFINNYNFSVVKDLFYWLSDGKSPIDTQRVVAYDNGVNLSINGLVLWKRIFLYLLPLLTAIGYLVTNVRRKNK